MAIFVANDKNGALKENENFGNEVDGDNNECDFKKLYCEMCPFLEDLNNSTN